MSAHFYIVLPVIQRDVTIYAITRLVCAFMIQTHVDFVLRMGLIVPLHMAIMIYDHLYMILRKYKHWKIQTQILILPPMDQTFLIKSVT